MADPSQYLRAGDNCWRVSKCERAALLFEAAGYYGALRQALLKARRSVTLAGWDIDSRTPIRGESAPEDGAPETLGPLLSWLVEQRPALHIRVLLWDYSLLYALEREPLPRLNLDWKTPRRIRTCLDSNLPFGASHHEKLAVIDDRLAFCGGIDLTIRRWDRRAHEPGDPDRRDPNGEAYGPYHDLQLLVDGSVARDLAELVLERWNRAAGTRARLVEVDEDPWPEPVEPDLRGVMLGILRTQPAWREHTELRQVEAAYLAAIAAAERLIYIENQYLTAPAIARALAERLRAQESLELVIVNPKTPSGWLEERTMGRGRARFFAELGDPELGERVRLLYPWVADDEQRQAVMVHAKLMLVDDRWLQIGSSNLNCRSMGVDRECDLVIVARDADERAAIKALRLKLLAHHLGVAADSLAAAEADRPALIAHIDAEADSGRGLARLEAPAAVADEDGDLLVTLADPERPIDPERFVGDLFGAEPGHPLRRHLLRLSAAAALIALAIVLWRSTPLADLADPERIGALLARAAASVWSGPIVLACFVIGSFCLFPVTVLIAATGVALPPASAFFWAFVGTLASAALNFALGRRLPEAALKRWFGEWLGRFNDKLRRTGIVPMMLIRNLPVAPFTVVNVLAGAARIRLRDFLLGTAFGMAPGIAVLTLLGDRLRGVWQDPGWLNLGLLVLAVAAWFGVALGLQALSNRLADGA